MMTTQRPGERLTAGYLVDGSMRIAQLPTVAVDPRGRSAVCRDD